MNEPHGPSTRARSAPPAFLLPPEAYTSQEWFDREMEHLFGRVWSFAGMTDDLTDPGDYVCVTAGRQPIVVLRDGTGTLRAFHNICRHRGAQLLEGSGNAGRSISCFYHRWRYELDGALRNVPQPDQFPGLCKEDWGLKPAAVDSWNGLMFVHPEPQPDVDLMGWLAGFPDAMGPYRPLELKEIRPLRHQLHANWKLFLENHVDGYHLWHLHARSIKGLDHGAQDWTPTGRHWTFHEPPSEPGAFPDQELTGLPLLPTIPSGGYGSSVQLVFPNLGLAGGATFWVTVHVVPLAPDRTEVVMRTRIAPEAVERPLELASMTAREAVRRVGRSPVGSALRKLKVLPESADRPDLVIEDLRAAESIQRTIRSAQFQVGPMAVDYENAITFFQQNILDHLDPNRVDS